MPTAMEVFQSDITTLQVDALVNAANSSLLGGGGVDGAIHRAAGPQLLAECRLLKGCEVGKAKITQAYQLPAKFVIHTVGPVWRGGNHQEAALLASCYQESLKLARRYRIKSIAFPAISCGVYGYPIDQAAVVAIQTVQLFLRSWETKLEIVYFVCFDKLVFNVYRKILGSLT
ncbi:MAG: O-acetyl-ADP-ribose deacetylase [Gammaproteobacteria bacterium RIFCSPHIGHO2_12_FULL_35_23]|nr:MAG: O-acetyl-ADP-ribose deacetylase [Gammaproteobacteria bacterium RIFCSPHIGHO2_12_FULL_35_23]